VIFGRSRAVAKLRAMSNTLAEMSFLICLYFYGFIVAALSEGISTWGLGETIEILRQWFNLLLLATYVLIGTFFLQAGVVLLSQPASE
jgi:hypothetical protein